MKILTVVGARPQFIKAAAVSGPLRRAHHEVLLHTGQHYDDAMSDLFFRELQIPAPDFNLGVGSGTHGAQTASMLIGIERVVLSERPDWVLVYGDTNSTLAGALAAAKLHIPLAHVEAGLRSYDRRMPEEINRVLTDHVSDLCFCPTETAVQNLRRESIVEAVHMVGDVMYDVMRYGLSRLDESDARTVTELGLQPGAYVLATVHRAENVDDPARLLAVLHGLEETDMPVIFPVHPRTRRALQALQRPTHRRIHLLDPVGYLEMLALEKDARVVVTDSGGVQKEAYLLGTPCVTVRERTEWVETVESGWNLLVGTDSQAIAEAVRSFRPTGDRPPLFGDGSAASKIVDLIGREGR